MNQRKIPRSRGSSVQEDSLVETQIISEVTGVPMVQHESQTLADVLSESSEGSYSDDSQPIQKGASTLGKRPRKENGLVTLTIKFIELLKKAPM